MLGTRKIAKSVKNRTGIPASWLVRFGLFWLYGFIRTISPDVFWIFLKKSFFGLLGTRKIAKSVKNRPFLVISLVCHAYENRDWTKCRNFFVFVMAYFANKAYYWRNAWRYESAVFFVSCTRTSWTSPCIFYPANVPQFLKHSCTSGQFWIKYWNFENRKISTLSKKIKNWCMA